MPTLAELKAKWFLDFNSGVPSFPPRGRHPGSTVSDHTDGNLVTPLIDGQQYMGRWYDLMKTLQSADCDVFHSAAWLENVPTLGLPLAGHPPLPTSTALDVMHAAHALGVKIYILLNQQINAQTSNMPTYLWFQLHGIEHVVWDLRYPVGGSNHSKYIVLKDPNQPHQAVALVASCDLVSQRWDTSLHVRLDPIRPTLHPTHEVGVEIRGPAATDIERSFRDRWNDRSYSNISWITALRGRKQPPPPLLQTPVSAPPAMGTHSVQVLHTYGITPFGYTWSDTGEFTIWASYLNAIINATTYIYIEEQYFLPFGWPPSHLRDVGHYRDSDIVYQLGRALLRNVDVIILVPYRSEDSGSAAHQKYQRNIGVNYLATIAAGAPGDVTFAYMCTEAGVDCVAEGELSPGLYVHGKMMIVDDEFVLLGSANICQRSISTDGEIHLGIIDANNTFAHDLRVQLWQEHLEVAIPPDLGAALDLFRTRVINEQGRMRQYPTAYPQAPPRWHDFLIQNSIDPYEGPSRV